MTPLVPSDLYALVMALDPQIAPDGDGVYFRRATIDREGNATIGTIWYADPAGDARAFTAGRDDRSPRVSPDGKQLAFVSDRDGATHLMLMPTGGGEARALGAAVPKAGAPVWSPDGSRIAIVMPAPHDPPSARVYHDEASGARHIRALPFKSDTDGLLDGTRKHLFLIDVATGESTQITRGDFDVGGIAWSPAGDAIAFAAAIDLPEAAFGSDVHVVALASGERRMLTARRGAASSPAWSPDGRTIAYLGHTHGGDAGGRFNVELLVVPAGGGEIASLSAHVDRCAGDTIGGDLRSGFGGSAPVWSRDGDEILVQLSVDGACEIRAFATGTPGDRIVAGGERDVFAFTATPDGAVAVAYSTATVPSEIAHISPGGDERWLTTMNPWLDERAVIAPERYRPRAADGTLLDGWLLRPTAGGTDPLPLVLEIHGGPHAAYGWTFFFEFQVLAGLGMAVAYGNPRGSQSYGHAYADAITGDWGGIDAADVHAILDGALERGSFDTSRIGVAGGSYGGFMTSWLLGHSDRFAAGVSMRAVNDFVSEAGASDLGWFLETETQAPPLLADGGRRLFELSPMRAAPNIDVPLLVEHSERDYRCPIDQGEQLFTLLRRLCKTNVEFVRFTGDGHELSRSGKPRNRVLRLRAIAQWFVRHLRPAGIDPPADEAGALFRALPGEGEDGGGPSTSSG